MHCEFLILELYSCVTHSSLLFQEGYVVPLLPCFHRLTLIGSDSNEYVSIFNFIAYLVKVVLGYNMHIDFVATKRLDGPQE